MYSVDDEITPVYPVGKKRADLEERFDRQLRIQGWDQRALDEARIGVVGDDDLLASLYTLSAAALGINNIAVMAPILDENLINTAQKINPRLNLAHLQGYYTHSLLDDIFTNCNLLVDLSHYGLANKLLLEKGYRENIPIIRGFCYEENGQEGFRIFTYVKGREWRELHQLIPPHNLPRNHFDDGVFDIIVSGIALEETKNILMHGRVSASIISHERNKLEVETRDQSILVTGSGALGVFLGLGLAYSGFEQSTFMDSMMLLLWLRIVLVERYRPSAISRHECPPAINFSISFSLSVRRSYGSDLWSNRIICT